MLSILCFACGHASGSAVYATLLNWAAFYTSEH